MTFDQWFATNYPNVRGGSELHCSAAAAWDARDDEVQRLRNLFASGGGRVDEIATELSMFAAWMQSEGRK